MKYDIINSLCYNDDAPEKHGLQLIYEETSVIIDINSERYSLKKIDCNVINYVIGSCKYDISATAQVIDFYDDGSFFNEYKYNEIDKYNLSLYVYNDGWFTTNWSDGAYQSIRVEFADVDPKYRNSVYLKFTLLCCDLNVDRRSIIKFVRYVIIYYYTFYLP